ncbi:MAG: DNA-3-methyladenine glycosylase 2 family protein [Candidatus Zixiibacteriota bacterium]|nr:MAG: DNA-3-methyladenine glycosylase 2 family protein [candidate division Zixibacteria bacterium]
MNTDTILLPTPPYDFARSFSYMERRIDPIARWDGEVFTRLWPLGDRDVPLQLRSAGTVDHPRVILSVLDDVSDDDRLALAASVTRAFSLDLDLNAFHAGLRHDAVLDALAQRNRGLKPAREPNLFEALAWAIIGQQIHLLYACQIKAGMLERYGGRVAVGEEWLYRHPRPADLVHADPQDWRAFKCSRRKAEYVIGLAREVANGFDLESLADLPDEEIIARLTRLRGLGRWTAEYTLVRGLGRWNALPATDAGLVGGIRRAYGLQHRPTTGEIEALAEAWRPWRGLATYYLWWAK